MISLTYPAATLVSILIFLAGLATLDFVGSAVNNEVSKKWFDRKHAPKRLIVYGGIAYIATSVYLATTNLTAGAVMIIGFLVLGIGLAWHNHVKNQPDDEPAQPPAAPRAAG